MNSTASTLLILPLLMLAAPVLARAVGVWVKVPLVVFELALGVLAGPAVLGLVHPNDILEHTASAGVALLFFVAGSEIEASSLRGRRGRRAWLGWVLSLVIGTGLGFALSGLGGGNGVLGAVIIGIALSSTALGTLLPILRDTGSLRTPFGESVGALGAVGEFGPIVAISLLLGGRSPGAALIVLIAFAVVAALSIRQAQQMPHGRLHRFVESTLHTSGQFAIRLVVAILGALVALSITLQVDMLLGAFTAGLVWKNLIADADPDTRKTVEAKIDALAFGFLVPIFFIVTGMNLDLGALGAHLWTPLLVPAMTLALLVVRGLPSTLVAPAGSTWRDRTALGLMGATGLPIIVVVTNEGVEQHLMTGTQAAIMVSGGVLSVLLFPLIANSLHGSARSRADRNSG
ncbi:MAG: cation:proton antiporter [Gordonia sp. (in: high G+C Gram-positive bacteria)]